MQPENQSTNLLTTQPIPDGFTWTLTTRLGHMLRLAEEQFGPRDHSYTILGIEFVADGPRIWYPGNCRHIAIQLSLDALHDEICACYELAHETIHLLSPTGTAHTTVLEEGLATYYSRQYLQEHLYTDWSSSGEKNYDFACEMITSLLSEEPQAVKKLRVTEPSLSKISNDLIMAHCPSLKNRVGRSLAAKFDKTPDAQIGLV